MGDPKKTPGDTGAQSRRWDSQRLHLDYRAGSALRQVLRDIEPDPVDVTKHCLNKRIHIGVTTGGVLVPLTYADSVSLQWTRNLGGRLSARRFRDVVERYHPELLKRYETSELSRNDADQLYDAVMDFLS